MYTTRTNLTQLHVVDTQLQVLAPTTIACPQHDCNGGCLAAGIAEVAFCHSNLACSPLPFPDPLRPYLSATVQITLISAWNLLRHTDGCMLSLFSLAIYLVKQICTKQMSLWD